MKESHRGEEKEGAFGRLRDRYDRYLEQALPWRWPIIGGYLALTALILLVVAPLIGTEIFPESNGPVLRMRLKAPVGTRIEETEPMVLQALDLIRKTVGKDNVADHVGLHGSSALKLSRQPDSPFHQWTGRGFGAGPAAPRTPR